MTMQIHVARNSAQLGVFSAEDITAGLASQRFLASDLGWREGMSAWTPLGDWAEFRASIPYVPPSAASGPGDVAPVLTGTTFPWEISKSFSSAYASFLALIRDPAAILAGARLEFVTTLQLVWLILFVASVFSVVGGIIHAEALAQAMRTAGAQLSAGASKIPGPMGQAFAKVAEYFSNTKAKEFGEVVMQVLLVVAAQPLYYLLIGLIQWLGLRLLGLFGVKSCKTPELGRTAIAGMLGHVLLGAILCPVALLSPQGLMQQMASVIIFIVGVVLYCRVVGGALRINPWVVFGSAVLLYVTVSCCCFAICPGYSDKLKFF